jgi:hypothetical protein
MLVSASTSAMRLVPNVAVTVAALLLTGTIESAARAQFERSRHFSEEFQKQGVETVVRITATDGTTAWQGSGVCMAYSEKSGVAFLLTAGHVVKDAKKLAFEVFTQASYPTPALKSSRPSGGGTSRTISG